MVVKPGAHRRMSGCKLDGAGRLNSGKKSNNHKEHEGHKEERAAPLPYSFFVCFVSFVANFFSIHAGLDPVFHEHSPVVPPWRPALGVLR